MSFYIKTVLKIDDCEHGYSMKIRLCNGIAEDGAEKFAEIMLPASDKVFMRAMRRIGVENLRNCYVGQYYSDRFNAGMMQFFSPAESISDLNDLAAKLDTIPQEKIKEFEYAVADSLDLETAKDMSELVDKFLAGEYQREKAMRDCKEDSLRQLTAVAVNMATAFGKEAASDIGRIKELFVDFVDRWGLTEQWLEQFDMDVAEATTEGTAEFEDQESGMEINMM